MAVSDIEGQAMDTASKLTEIFFSAVKLPTSQYDPTWADQAQRSVTDHIVDTWKIFYFTVSSARGQWAPPPDQAGPAPAPAPAPSPPVASLPPAALEAAQALAGKVIGLATGS